MTTKQFVAAMRRVKGAPALDYQSSVWPYPQEGSCCLEVWRADAPREASHLMPGKRLCVPTDRRGGKMHVRGGISPTEAVAKL